MTRPGPLSIAVVALTSLMMSAALGVTPPASAQDAGEPVVSVEVRGSPLLLGQTGKAGRATVRVRLSGPASLRLRIADFDGRTVRTLIDGQRAAGSYSRRWNGRDDAGAPVPPGPYRAIAVADPVDGREDSSDDDSDRRDGRVRAEDWITVAERKVYPRRPRAITVVLDAGHGGPAPGAKGADGTREADLNLDITLRAAAMLEGAGVDVVLTRDADAPVNEPAIDRTGDGIADETDELAARNDIANLARADLFIAVHNNVAVNTGVGGPSTFYSDERTFSARSARLARIIQTEMMRALSAYEGDGWEPFDHGALTYPYYVLRDYDPPRLQRPTLMPAVLSEGLFLSNPRELRLLKRAPVRGAMAVAYYDAIARYLANRASNIAYEAITGPPGLAPGEAATYEVDVRNTGTSPMRGWTLGVGALRAPPLYDGRGRRGAPAGRARIPRLGPGEKSTVTIDVTAPAGAGDWLLLFDARDGDGQRLSRLGAPALQVPLRVLEPTTQGCVVCGPGD